MTQRADHLAETLKACLQSDSPALWNTLIDASLGAIAATVNRTLRQWTTPQPEMVEDLVQEVCVILCADNYAALRRFRADRPEALLAYIKTVASSAAVDHLRALAAQKRGGGRAHATVESVEHTLTDHLQSATAERLSLRIDVERCLQFAVGENTRDHWIFWLYYEHGLTARAIAGIASLKLSTKGVESSIARMTRQVRDCLTAGKSPGKLFDEGKLSRKASN